MPLMPIHIPLETHIYRLEKKINDVFLDEKFILNNKKDIIF